MRPKIAPGLLAALLARVPARIVKKLDGAPDVAKTWAWSDLTVQTDGGETVTLRPVTEVLGDVDQLHCTCLLAPRCFHLLAVASALEIDEGAAHDEATLQAEPQSTARAHAETRARVPVLSGQRATAELALRVVEDVLRAGAAGAGAVLQGELLRLVHEARLEGVHRVSSAALRVVRGIRSLRAGNADFSTAQLTADVADLLATAHAIASQPDVPEDVLGAARRAYSPRGNLRLSGLLCEPVIARGGYAGVSSWVVDDQGLIFTITDVVPAGPSRAMGAYDLAIALGDTTISHRELARESLFVQNATASEDYRLGAGQGVKAVRGAASTSWSEGGVALRFQERLEAQLARAFAAFAETEERARAATALFMEGTILGFDREGLVLADPSFGRVRLVPSLEHEELRYAENLRLLSRAAGARVRAIGLLVPDAPKTIAALAVSAVDDSLPLSAQLRGRINLGLDRLVAADVGGTTPTEFERSAAHVARDPLLALRRRLERLVLHGVRSLPTEAGPVVDAERGVLDRAMLERGSQVLAALHGAVLASARGEPVLARSFHASYTYVRAVTRSLQQARFLAVERGGA